jgi:Ran GTPase-activating protein (RanGAP) involved in mRNA processing and transport
LNIISCANISD